MSCNNIWHFRDFIYVKNTQSSSIKILEYDLIPCLYFVNVSQFHNYNCLKSIVYFSKNIWGQQPQIVLTPDKCVFDEANKEILGDELIVKIFGVKLSKSFVWLARIF